MNYRWSLLRAGPIRLDGGGMFGVIPRVVWTKLIPPDDAGAITLSHNCLLLQSETLKVIIETGSGNKLDDKMRKIFGLTDRTIIDAIQETGMKREDINHVIVSHLHFDHAGGLTRLNDSKIEPSFPRATIHVQKREWEDATANKSTMTRTYFKENWEAVRDRFTFADSPLAFKPGETPRRDELPTSQFSDRLTEILLGISVFRIPGHTWGQQAILFTDDRNRKVVFTADLMPTVHHVGATYNLAYDVEPYTSTITRHWFLKEAAENHWLLVLDHEPGNPLVRVRPDDKGWYKFVPEEI